MQQAHFCCRQILAWSCLQIGHMHASWLYLSLFLGFDSLSAYHHITTTGIPMIKNTTIVRTGIRRTNREIPKHMVAMPTINSTRFD
jgi:hypothetical protein